MNGAKLVATHKSRYFERQDGLAIGPGAFVTALEYASGKEAIVVGKPSPTFYQSVMKDFSCPPSEVVMIGDVRKRTSSSKIILYSGKLSREKTFINFVFLEPPAKIFSTKFGCVTPTYDRFQHSAKVFSTKGSLLTDP